MPNHTRTQRSVRNPGPKPANRLSVTGLIFVSGAVLMALEIAGSRVLAPFFGSSVFVWGSLIGIFLGAMSGGYWLGGWLSERWPRQTLLNMLLAAGGGFTLILPLWAASLCRALAGGPESLVDLGPRLGPLIAAVILFALPSLLMGVASPFAVRLLAADIKRVGAVAGQLYAVGSLGSIAGTLVTAFWLIPALGVNTILTGIGAALVLAAAVTIRGGRAGLIIFSVGIGLLSLRLLVEPPMLLAQPGKGRFVIVETRESPYTSMSVVDHVFTISGGQEKPIARQLRFGKYVQGSIFVHPWQKRGREHWSAAPYTDLFHLVRLFTPEIKSVLFIGGGVGVGPRSFRRHYPEADIDLVEIDPAVVELARKYFHFTPDARTRLHIEDGRTFLRRNPNRSWDAVILDAFTIGGRLPFHLMTREFFQELRKHLKPGGVVLANLPSALAGQAGRVFRAEYVTYQSVFDQVYVFPRQSTAEHDHGSLEWWQRPRNIFLAATVNPELISRKKLLAIAERLWGGLQHPPNTRETTELFFLYGHAANMVTRETLEQGFPDRYITDAPVDFRKARVLTDDYAPVDTLDF